MNESGGKIKDRHVKVLKLKIAKPEGETSWPELNDLLFGVRYRVFRLANLYMTDRFQHFMKLRSGELPEKSKPGNTIADLNRALMKMLESENGKKKSPATIYSNEGALPSYVTGALEQYKLRALTQSSKWGDVARGKSALPSFRLDMPIPIRCDGDSKPRLKRDQEGKVILELAVKIKPRPSVVIATGERCLSDSCRATLNRLLDNNDNELPGYRQRCLEIKYDSRRRDWFVFVTYDFPEHIEDALDPRRVVGVDVGFSAPVYCALSDGYARLGRRAQSTLVHQVRRLQGMIFSRRREILQGGNDLASSQSCRSGHGRKRKLRGIEKLRGKIDAIQTHLNHQLSNAVVAFALQYRAGTVHLEDLAKINMQEELTGTFLGERWRYEELQRFIKYKSEEHGIEVEKIDPQYTSQRCSRCGEINFDFTWEFRQSAARKGKRTRFSCPFCEAVMDVDYNAARNIALHDIEERINAKLKEAGRNGKLEETQSLPPSRGPAVGPKGEKLRVGDPVDPSQNAHQGYRDEGFQGERD